MQIAFDDDGDDDGDEDDDYDVCVSVFSYICSNATIQKRIAIVSKCTANDRAADVRYSKPTTAKHCKKIIA